MQETDSVKNYSIDSKFNINERQNCHGCKKTVMGVRTLKLTYLHPCSYFQIVSKTLCKVVTNSTAWMDNTTCLYNVKINVVRIIKSVQSSPRMLRRHMGTAQILHSALDEEEWSASCLNQFTHMKMAWCIH